MALTPAQKATFKNAIAANTTPAGGTGTYASTPINQIPNTSDGLIAIRDFYNTLASPNFYVFRTSVPISELQNQIAWASYTPSDAVPATAVSPFTLSETILIWQSRALKAQGMQLNLQNILIGAQGSLNAANPGIRSGLVDAMTNLPTGATTAATFATGAVLSGGWGTVRDNALARLASVVEKLFATTTAQQDGSTPAKAATMTLEGPISEGDVDAAINS